MPLSHSFSSHLWSSSLRSFISSLNLTLSTPVSHCQRPRHRNSTSSTHQPSQAADRPQTHAAICLRPMPPIRVLARGYWVLDWETHRTRWPTPSANPARRRCACLWLVIFYFDCDWWFSLVWVEEKDWRFGFFYLFFIFYYCCGLVAGGGGCGCGWW